MKVYLTKQKRKTTDFILLEADDKFVRTSSGKIGKSGVANSTLNAGSPDKAIAEIHSQVEEYKKQGFSITEVPTDVTTKDIVFDKAKWHINEQFPTDLDHYQSYVHTGFYVAWLIERNFIQQEFKEANKDAIQKHALRQSSPVSFYESQLDGVFDADGLTQEAIKFTIEYFNFERGQYLKDYLDVLDPQDALSSLFHVSDSWENYDKLKPVLEKRYEAWKKISNH